MKPITEESLSNLLIAAAELSEALAAALIGELGWQEKAKDALYGYYLWGEEDEV